MATLLMDCSKVVVLDIRYSMFSASSRQTNTQTLSWVNELLGACLSDVILAHTNVTVQQFAKQPHCFFLCLSS